MFAAMVSAESGGSFGCFSGCGTSFVWPGAVTGGAGVSGFAATFCSGPLQPETNATNSAAKKPARRMWFNENILSPVSHLSVTNKFQNAGRFGIAEILSIQPFFADEPLKPFSNVVFFLLRYCHDGRCPGFRFHHSAGR